MFEFELCLLKTFLLGNLVLFSLRKCFQRFNKRVTQMQNRVRKINPHI